MARMLVVYATGEGQSEKIAAQIAADIRDYGFEATIADAKRLVGTTPPSSDGVVVVASVHMGRHGRSVARFVRERGDWLQARPSAFLSVSLSAASKHEQSQRGAQAILDRFLESCAWQPTLATTVAGALRYSRYGLLMRWIMRSKARGEGEETDLSRDYEYTDWEKLRAQVHDFLDHVDQAEVRSGSTEPPPLRAAIQDHSRQSRTGVRPTLVERPTRGSGP